MQERSYIRQPYAKGVASTRDRIMDAALRSFGARGVAATSITSIEAAAGLSAGSGGFYRHFKDKDALLAAVVDREIERVEKPEPPADLGGESALTVQLRGDLEFLSRMRPLISILMWERGGNRAVLERVQTVMMDRGVDLGVADLLASNPTAAVQADPAAAAAVMTAAMVGYFLQVDYFGAGPAGVDADRFTKTLANLLLGQ
ncbi:TetR family transcriptional regulator [Nocardiaceae bacterium YC2-7]|uniref:TetR family transcriptional regulator n=1 Tax=Antrihabitans stalactiti TaxID=2584121 RepID=A0A848K902_9NOCA|nr:TetR family transcriptional regulator [Antrihabitans stalactiti]